ncbi:MFS transporter [Rhizorhapis sp. SPR117]|uniref:MFS transporter n=1 Tax=Rhizorhapis sp. SPR117 TaxID=2912611 RepID=UPI001EFFA0EA|nr:MFS transporter [Rhizorhapis sp. SPR117]
MQVSLRLLGKRRFLPIFGTQFLGAFNDNLFKTAMVLFATYTIYSDPRMESNFNALSTGLFILPFFILSALSGQLADSMDKARIIRIVKIAEIGIMAVGSIGLMLKNIPLMLVAVLAMGVHSTFFGPIKYAILPQHLKEDEVLGGTGLVEAGTYLAILAGTIAAGWMNAEVTAATVMCIAIAGYYCGRQVPPAPPVGDPIKIDHNPLRSSWRLISITMHIPRLFLAICAISFFWMIGSILIIIFPPLVKNVFTASKEVASLFLAIFSIGVAIGSVAINRLLRGNVSAKFGPASVLAMGGFILYLYIMAHSWAGAPSGQYYDVSTFIAHPGAWHVVTALLGIAISGGMFVVPLYAFLTTTVSKGETARTVAANNVVNSGAMTIGALAILAATNAGLSVTGALLLVAAMCLASAWLAWKLHCACD